ncbi:hypothetical protein [Salinisphaera sp.]|uniref:hypothetical protein n=1 Tax=Salinisphaera sp. TaxID=1914330 RepID=UPI0025E1E0E4|nr:hypothetical protein [Salinisphaera sp.]
MPHLFTNRPRAGRHYGNVDEIDLGQIWETKNSLLYELGGVLFISGPVSTQSAPAPSAVLRQDEA